MTPSFLDGLTPSILTREVLAQLVFIAAIGPAVTLVALAGRPRVPARWRRPLYWVTYFVAFYLTSIPAGMLIRAFGPVAGVSFVRSLVMAGVLMVAAGVSLVGVVLLVRRDDPPPRDGEGVDDDPTLPGDTDDPEDHAADPEPGAGVARRPAAGRRVRVRPGPRLTRA